MSSFEKKLEDIQSLVELACTDGTWNYDPYFHGMANGMILYLSIMEDKEPEFLSAPDEWLYKRDPGLQPTLKGES